MYIKLSTKRDIDRNDPAKSAAVIRELVKALTTPNFSAASLNADVVNIPISAVIDTKNPGWTLVGSTKEGTTLGSGSNFELGDTWTISKGGKEVTFHISDTSSGPVGAFGIHVTSSTSPVVAELFPGTDIHLLSGAGTNINVSSKVGINYTL